MNSFLDASVIVAIVGGEEDEQDWAEALRAAPAPQSSAIAVWEAVRAVSRLRGIDTEAALTDVRALIDLRGIEIIATALSESVEALRTHDRYGKGNHAAKLNMGDCFAYACARLNGAKLLYKGGDFAKTDMA